VSAGAVTGNSARAATGRPVLVACGLAVAFVVALAWPTHQRQVGGYFTESDFYGRYAPDADRIRAGRVPEDTVSPPGYPLLLALLYPLTGDHFTSGKWLALAAAALTAIAASRLFHGLFGAREAMLGPLFLLISGEFTKFSIQATTDLPFVLAAVAATLTLIGGDRLTVGRAALGGALTGAACLIRYNGIFLVPVGLAAAAMAPPTAARAGRLRAAAVYAAVAAATLTPWLVISALHHGTPFYSTNYRDVAVLYHGSARDVTSLWQVVTRDPLHFAARYASLVVTNLGRSLGASFAVVPVGALALAGVVACVRAGAGRALRLFLLAVGSCFLVLALMHWETRYYFFAVVAYTGLAAHAIVRLVDWLRARHRVSRLPARLLLLALVVAIVGPSLDRAHRRLWSVLGREPREVLGASDYLRRTGPTGLTVMAVKPHVAYLSRARWAELPRVRSVEQLREALRRAPADYVVYDRMVRRYVAGLQALEGPGPDPAWLAPVYADRAGGLVLYAVRPGG
jgi:hypothetical protein